MGDIYGWDYGMLNQSVVDLLVALLVCQLCSAAA